MMMKFRVLRYSTKTLTPNNNIAATTDKIKTTLFHRLVAFHEPSVVPILDQWVDQGRPIDQQDLYRIIKQFRKFGRYKHALQVLLSSLLTIITSKKKSLRLI